MTFQLSIIIPVFNKYAFTKSCLQDLFKLPIDTHEIIVFDNGSTDETHKELSIITQSNFKYVRSEVNGGFAFACNRGYAAALAPNVLFLNNDIRVKNNYENWTQPLIDNCVDTIVGPTMGQLDNHFNFIREAHAELTGTNIYMSGWCLAASKKTLDKLREKDYIGPFSEDFFCYFEDTNLSFLANRLHIPFKVVSIPVVHFGKISSKQLNTYDLYVKAKKIFTDKWSKK